MNQGPDLKLSEVLRQPFVIALLASATFLSALEFRRILTLPGAPFGPERKPIVTQADPPTDVAPIQSGEGLSAQGPVATGALE